MLKENAKKEKSLKPKYTSAQNMWFMIKLAWTSGEKKVLLLSLLSALTAVALNLINLYVSPTVLSVVERNAPVMELIGTIVLFVLALMLLSATSAYVNTNTLYGRISVRQEFIALLNKKAATTSYPNLSNENFRELNIKAQMSIISNSSATEAIWTTLTDLITNMLGFAVYILLLSSVQPVLLVMVLLTSTVSYLIGNRLNEWGYRHREEELKLSNKVYYLTTCGRNLTAAKDIRIFGLRPWIDELCQKGMDAYIAFHQKAEGVYFWAKVIDLVLAFVRNGIAYAYLIALVVAEGLDVAEFLLYFSAVSGFATWVTRILGGFTTLHKQSLDISSVREYLEFDEPFQFEGGEHIQPEADRMYEIRLENVSFRYPGADYDTLANINLTLHPGEKLAVVGLNGVGKLPLLN